jgi:hypothetical protein
MKCYTTRSNKEELELTQTRDRLKSFIEQTGGAQAAKMLDDLWNLEEMAKNRAFLIGAEEAKAATLPYLPAHRLIELIKEQMITEDEALAAIEAGKSRQTENQPEQEAAQ